MAERKEIIGPPGPFGLCDLVDPLTLLIHELEIEESYFLARSDPMINANHFYMNVEPRGTLHCPS